MKLSCPHCSQTLELTPDVLASLQGQPHFECPACQGLIAVPAQPQRPMPRRPQPPARAAAGQAQRGMNRNLLVLGVVALLVLGGIAAFLASRNGGSITNIFQNTTNNIIHNNYFTQLIASGATTLEELQAIAEIRPYGSRFIGITRDAMSWSQVQDVARRTGAQVMTLDGGDARTKLLAWVDESYSTHLSTTAVWVRENGEARAVKAKEVASTADLNAPKKALLEWRVPQMGGATTTTTQVVQPPPQPQVPAAQAPSLIPPTPTR